MLNDFTKNQKFLMLAFDQRGSFRKLISPDDPDSVSIEEGIALKKKIIDSLKDQFSGILVDQEFGLPAIHQLNLDSPFLLPLEKSGATEQDGEKTNELEFTLKSIIDDGASAAKLLLFFNPEAKSAPTQIQTARNILNECRERGFPFFLEIVTYNLEGQNKSTGELILSSLDLLLENNIFPDVYKLEYPGKKEQCAEITKKLLGTPWILLTRGVPFEEFTPKLEDAVASGCVGFLAGRAIWQEACKLKGEELETFLNTTLKDRFRKVCEIALNSN